MRKSESRNLVELISEHVRDMQLERLQLMQKRYQETHQGAIQKEMAARRNLVELEMNQEEDKRWSLSKSISSFKAENSFIGGWNDYEAEQHTTEQPPKTARPSTHVIRRRPYRSAMSEDENIIPQLKNLLKRLQSPEKKRQQNLLTAQNFNIQLARDITSRRKQTVKVSDILKLHENWVSCPMPPNEGESCRPLRSAHERLNLNQVGRQTAYPFRMPSQEGSRNRLQSLKEQQIIELIKKKRVEQSAKRRPKEGMSTVSANILTTPRRQYSSMKRNSANRQKLTLVNLLQ